MNMCLVSLGKKYTATKIKDEITTKMRAARIEATIISTIKNSRNIIHNNIRECSLMMKQKDGILLESRG